MPVNWLAQPHSDDRSSAPGWRTRGGAPGPPRSHPSARGPRRCCPPPWRPAPAATAAGRQRIRKCSAAELATCMRCRATARPAAAQPARHGVRTVTTPLGSFLISSLGALCCKHEWVFTASMWLDGHLCMAAACRHTSSTRQAATWPAHVSSSPTPACAPACRPSCAPPAGQPGRRSTAPACSRRCGRSTCLRGTAGGEAC